MIITMQGNWTVRVKSKNAAFPQRFIVSGAASGNGTYNGVTGAPAVFVTGSQWTIAIQHNPGTGFQLSDAKLTFPQQVGLNYQFDVQSNDSGADQDFDDLILTCSRFASPNDFIIYGNVSLYSGSCHFNPCRRDIFVIETLPALEAALKNRHLREVIETLYPERVPPFRVDPNPPDPPYFSPIVLDLFGEATQPKTTMNVRLLEDNSTKPRSKATAKEAAAAEESPNFRVEEAASTRAASAATGTVFAKNMLEIARAIDSFSRLCTRTSAAGITLSFEEYNRTIAEQAGGPYTGTGDRRLLGDTITDMFGNYIFHFSFDMTFPGLEDADDSFPGQSVNQYAYPDVIVKVTGVASWDVLYESAPYFNIPNLRRIDLCLPKSRIRPTSACANGNLIDSLGNVFIGGNQNTSASTATADLIRDGFNNYLSEKGVISVSSSLAGFPIQCAAWTGMIDVFGCMYDETKPISDNRIRWYTIRIARKPASGAPQWVYVTENYKHPKFSKRNLPNYNGDDVGPFPTTISGVANTPAYKNIRFELHTGLPDTDWESAKIDRLMQLNTGLYDKLSGLHAPDTFFLRIDGFDAAGTHVAGKTDLIALFIHNKGINYSLSGPKFTDPSIFDAGCGLFRLTDAQNNTPITFKFEASDEFGFLNAYSLTAGRCPSPMIALAADPMADTVSGAGPVTLAGGSSTAASHPCNGYRGSIGDFGSGVITATIAPGAGEVGWVKPGEFFTIYSVSLSASQRVTNGYNTGLSSPGPLSGQIMMEKLVP
ncbi:MAG TPA: hypothetical protein VGC97_24915 [Pyrinomonadaceae bacterium]|jgi:hypothetical protein